MFWTSIIKAIPIVLQVILVVVAVALFAFFDPFGIFIQTRNNLKDTPVDVRSIREIGQLITAEYYGEVIGSYAHEVEQEQDTSRRIYHESMLELLNYYTQEINELNELLKVGEIRRKDIYDAYTESFEEVSHDPDFETLLYFISNRDKFKASRLDDRLSLRQKKKLVRDAVRSGYASNDAIHNSSTFLQPLFQAYEQTLQKDRKKQLKKKNLVMLGRGWVKAGFDFGSFNERNFRYDKANRNIYFIGFNPEIISATINPWFIPEEGVEGFEFLVVERKSRRDYKVVKLVKQRCLDELVRKAHEREIMLKAKENARESLKEFFTLLIDDEINEVIFYENEFDYVYHEIVKNDTIAGEELLLVDHMLRKTGIDGMDDQYFQQAKSSFVESLNESTAALVPFDSAESDVSFPVLAIAYAVCRDGAYDDIQDSRIISGYASRYCTLTNDIENFSFSCESMDSLSALIAANTNIFIGRTNKSMDSLQDKLAVEELDSLMDEQGNFVGLLAGGGHIPVLQTIIDDQVKKACTLCSGI